MVRNKRELEIWLSQVPTFISPSIVLEQYVCDSSIASELIWLAHMNKDIEHKIVVDLGCGTGILSYGALLLGASNVLCIDIDVKALKIAKKFIINKEYFHYFEVINGDIEKLWLRKIDTIIMNPPFGVHRRGIDLIFLRKALELNPRAIYTIHKYNPNSHKVIYETIKNSGYDIINMSVGLMGIPALYSIHKKHIHRFKVAIYAIARD